MSAVELRNARILDGSGGAPFDGSVAQVPANRFGSPDEFGKACAFLCSADAGYVVGQNLLTDGGYVNVTT